MNRKVFKAGMKKSHRIIHTHVQDILSSACERLLADAVQSKEFQGFTGNTQTSYACGIYMDGKLAYCSFQESWNRPPVRLKVEKGKYVYLSHPYEGHARGVDNPLCLNQSAYKVRSGRLLELLPFTRFLMSMPLYRTSTAQYTVLNVYSHQEN